MRKKLGQILVETGVTSAEDIARALAQQGDGEPERLGDLLLANGKLTSRDLARALAAQHQLPYVELPALPQAVLDLVPLELLRQYRFVPLEQRDTELAIAMADLANLEVVATLEQTWTRVHVSVAAGDEIDALLATMSGLFAPPSSPSPSNPLLAEDLFGSLDEASEAPASVAASPRPGVEDLFGDLNLESARTGIPVQASIDPLPVEAPSPELSSPAPEGVVDEADAEGADAAQAPSEGTGALLAMLADGGTGPVVDTPFRSERSAPLPIAALPAEAEADQAPVPGQPLPDWLGPSSPSAIGAVWTGALDHLAPSRLVVGVTRALLARGLVTEPEILAALGQKK